MFFHWVLLKSFRKSKVAKKNNALRYEVPYFALCTLSGAKSYRIHESASAAMIAGFSNGTSSLYMSFSAAPRIQKGGYIVVITGSVLGRLAAMILSTTVGILSECSDLFRVDLFSGNVYVGPFIFCLVAYRMMAKGYSTKFSIYL